ncbi:MAG: hypothetical protein KatS3mg105_3970 [Gemmatales bacterium]|nr:MAG: hypothetical protein KatS3mg105_3970 [Gemmatales bacterium]
MRQGLSLALAVGLTAVGLLRSETPPTGPAMPRFLPTRFTPIHPLHRSDEKKLQTWSGKFGHGENYEWLVGRLYYLHVRQCWTLRYAPIDVADRYGGSVTLVGAGNMEHFKEGQRVYVTGYLLNPESKSPAPRFRVASIRLLNY